MLSDVILTSHEGNLLAFCTKRTHTQTGRERERERERERGSKDYYVKNLLDGRRMVHHYFVLMASKKSQDLVKKSAK